MWRRAAAAAAAAASAVGSPVEQLSAPQRSGSEEQKKYTPPLSHSAGRLSLSLSLSLSRSLRPLYVLQSDKI